MIIENVWNKRSSALGFLNSCLRSYFGFGVGRKIYLRSYSRRARITEEYIRDRIMNHDNREQIITRLNRMKEKLGSPSVSSGRGHSFAAVLVPLCIVNDKLSLLYNLRSPFLSNHAGQVCFPGGKLSKRDNSIEDAALRETEEEMGVKRSNIEVWTSFAQVPDRRGKYHITPVLGYLPDLKISKLKKSEEVLDIFAISLDHLLRNENQSYTQFVNGWKMPVFINGKYNFWGITACLTEMFLINAFPEHYQLKFGRYKGNIKEKYM